MCVAARQFGVAMPNRSEGLLHFRAALEKHLGKEALETLAMIDVDFCNAFPSLEWGAGLLTAAPWTHWCHAAPAWRLRRIGAGPRVTNARVLLSILQTSPAAHKPPRAWLTQTHTLHL